MMSDLRNLRASIRRTHPITVRTVAPRRRASPIAYLPQCVCGWDGLHWPTRSDAFRQVAIHFELMCLKAQGIGMDEAYERVEQMYGRS